MLRKKFTQRAQKKEEKLEIELELLAAEDEPEEFGVEE